MDSSSNRDTSSSSSSSSSVNDSTRKLLADLDLVETHPHGVVNFDEIDDDLTMVIPDTPDRMTSAHLDENDGSSIVNPLSFVTRRGRTSNGRSILVPRTNDSFTLDNDSIFRRARIASTLNHHSHPLNLRTSIKPEHDSVLRRDQQGSSNVDEHGKGAYPTPCRNRERDNRKGSSKEGCSYPTNEVEDMTSFSQFQPLRRTRSGTCTASKLPRIGSRQGLHDEDCSLSISEVDKTAPATTVNSDPRLKCVKSPSHIFKFDPSPRVTGHRRLVRNGFISPCNTSKGKGVQLESDLTDTCQEMIPNPTHLSNRRSGFISASEMLKGNVQNENNGGIRETVHQVSHGASTSFQIHSISPDSEERLPVKAKGKEIMDESFLVSGQEDEPKTFSDRLGPVAAKGIASTRATHKGKITEEAVWENSQNNRRHAFDSGLSLSDVHENSVEEIDHVDPIHTSPEKKSFKAPHSLCNASNEKYLRNPQNLLKGKRKTRSRRSHDNECSTSGINGNFALPSFGQSSNASTINQNSSWCSTNATIIDVEELPSPEPRNTQNHLVSNESSARDLQVESDELLARELQEQLFNESPGLGGSEEFDARIAWTLQEEEGAQRTWVRSQRPQHRDESIAHLYRHYPRQPLPSISRRSQNNSRTSNYRVAQLRRNLNRRQMDLESNLDLLEALEAASYNITSPTVSTNNLLNIQRDFNENDYEMLLALDNDNHQHVGASSLQIESLPLSVMQSENSEEACAVCLENPSVGDTMRHLPCLHKFHKDCIDTWLKVKTCCPICKSDIA